MKRWMVWAVWAVWAVCLASAADDGERYPPLFSVALEQEFEAPALAFEEAKALILEHYYDPAVTEEALYWAAIEGMLRHISPPEHPELGKLWTERDYGPVRDGLKGVEVSLGVKSSYRSSDGSLRVSEVLPRSPAAGVLQVDDRILRIDGKPLKGLEATAVDGMLKGEPGTEVTLTVVRDVQVFDVTLTRKAFRTENLRVEQLAADTVYVELLRVTEGISGELAAALEALPEGTEQGILDLRGNGGGVFMEALRLAELFLPAKSVLLRTQTRDKTQNYISSNAAPLSLRLAILVDGGTGSAAEVFAAALQDHRRATVVGSKTYGKGVFEKTFTMTNACRLKFIIGAMYSPRKQSWQSKGVKPDFKAAVSGNDLKRLRKLPAATRARRDLALLTALKVLRLEH